MGNVKTASKVYVLFIFLLLGTLELELRRRRQRERQKSNQFNEQNNNSSLFCKFLWCPCTTTTWNDQIDENSDVFMDVADVGSFVPYYL